MFSFILLEIIQLVILSQKANYCYCLTAQIMTQSNKPGKKSLLFQYLNKDSVHMSNALCKRISRNSSQCGFKRGN